MVSSFNSTDNINNSIGICFLKNKMFLTEKDGIINLYRTYKTRNRGGDYE